MQKQPKTIYQAARIFAGYTQETAAELIHVSVESIRAYERGATIPPSDVVLQMIEIYKTPWLAYQYLKLHNTVGKRYLPDIQFRDLPTSVLMLQKEMIDTHHINGDMVEVTCDGKIEGHEQQKWKRVTTEISELIAAGLSVLFAPIKKEKSPVLAHRR